MVCLINYLDAWCSIFFSEFFFFLFSFARSKTWFPAWISKIWLSSLVLFNIVSLVSHCCSSNWWRLITKLVTERYALSCLNFIANYYYSYWYYIFLLIKEYFSLCIERKIKKRKRLFRQHLRINEERHTYVQSMRKGNRDNSPLGPLKIATSGRGGELTKEVDERIKSKTTWPEKRISSETLRRGGG